MVHYWGRTSRRERELNMKIMNIFKKHVIETPWRSLGTKMMISELKYPPGESERRIIHAGNWIRGLNIK
jgi:hypothetical protein